MCVVFLLLPTDERGLEHRPDKAGTPYNALAPNRSPMALPSSDASQAPADGAAGAADMPDVHVIGGWCRDCDYPLHGLTESTRCPECGRRFDPRIPGTMETRPPVGPVGRWFRRYPNVADGAGFGAWIGVVVALTSMWANVTSGTLLLCGLPVIFLVAARVRAAVRRKLIA